MLVVCLVVAVPLAIYLYNVAVWTTAWQTSPETDIQSVTRDVSVVIALHNEAENVEKLTSTLPSKSEVILVCDHCTDDTQERLQTLTAGKPNVRVEQSVVQQGKKHAQRYGVSLARYNYVAVTDADCVLPEKWTDALSSTEADMVIAPVVMKGDGRWLTHLFEIDFLALQASTAGAALRGRPFMCNGANLAFGKKIYTKHNAHTDYASGDDMFLLGEVKKMGGRIVYAKTRQALVQTTTPLSLKAFWRQRTRWLRKSSGYTDGEVKRQAATVFLANLSWPVLLLLGLVYPPALSIGVVAFALKTAMEFKLLRSTSRFFAVRVDLPTTLALAMLYPAMMLAITAGSMWRSRKTW